MEYPRRRILLSRARRSGRSHVRGPSPPHGRPMRQKRDLEELLQVTPRNATMAATCSNDDSAIARIGARRVFLTRPASPWPSGSIKPVDRGGEARGSARARRAAARRSPFLPRARCRALSCGHFTRVADRESGPSGITDIHVSSLNIHVTQVALTWVSIRLTSMSVEPLRHGCR